MSDTTFQKTLIITGPCGVGKTTTATAWAKKFQGAVIECDYLTEWIYKEDFPRWGDQEEALTAKQAADIAIHYLEAGMPVAIENVWTPLGLKILKHRLIDAHKPSIMTVRLCCDIKENHRRDEERIPENQMKERVDIVSNLLANCQWPDDVIQIDTTDMNIDQLIATIG